MDANELKGYVELGKHACVCVDYLELPEYPGYVRVIVFKRENRVGIDFYPLVYDVHTSFPEYYCDFQTLDDAIESIEDFLGKPISEWINYNKIGHYPVAPENDENAPSEESSKRLKNDTIEKKITLPRKGNFKLNLSLSLLNEDAYKAFMEKVNTDENYAIYKQADITYGTST